MSTNFDWQQVWQREFVNQPDGQWKAKSLNAQNAQTYSIKLPKAPPPPPSPKINKVNAKMFTITIDNQINLFYQQTEEKKKKNNGKVFAKFTYPLDQKAELVTGLTNEQGDNYIVVGTSNKMTVLKISGDTQYILQALPSGTKNIPEFRSLVVFGCNRIAAVSETTLYQFQVVDDSIKDLTSKKIQFQSEKHHQDFRTLKAIGICMAQGQNIYYFGSRQQKHVDQTKLKAGSDQVSTTECQTLTVVQMKLQIDGDILSVKAHLFPINHIFEMGLFTRTKIYQIEKETFLVSLHQEIILVKKHFTKFIVWDNVSVVTSRNQSLKGQLSLTNQNIMVFSENGQISAHQIFFDKQHKKLSMPPIDEYKGHQIEQILYDSLLLDTTDSIMKVLVYVKPGDVVYPGGYRGDVQGEKKKQTPNSIDFAIQCINQNEPLKKLQQMIMKQKPNKDIQEFCKRYNIKAEELLKSKWNVSNKELKQIQTILMGLKDDDFIQDQLNLILKKDSHNLQFLNNVQLKQGNRLKLLLAQKVTEYTKMQSLEEKEKMKEYIFRVLQWLMESDMFLKKIKYSKNFLVFKEYDFIQIGKLKAASLKEQIKLLSCKSFQKRLKYFLNQFKTLVIANFDLVFQFLLMDKSVKQIQKFLQDFNFILPHFHEPSDVFINKKDYKIMKTPQQSNTEQLQHKKDQQKNKRGRLLSFSPTAEQNDIILGVVNKPRPQVAKQTKSTLKEKSTVTQVFHDTGSQNCYLWQDLKKGEQIQQTLEAFIQKHINQLKGQNSQQAVRNLQKLIAQFQQIKWFKNAAFKQHCMITKTSNEIYEEFKQMKRKGAFKILIKFLYKEIERLEEEDARYSTKVNKREEAKKYQNQVNAMIEKFIREGFIPQSFKRNVDARVRVYKQVLLVLAQRKPDKKKAVALEVPLLSQFVVKSEPEYYLYIFQNVRYKILTDIKTIYDAIQPGFFKQRFQLFLKSQKITAQEIISFLDEFNQNVQADDIRIQVFSAIKRLLTLTDETNTRPYIQKSLQKEVLPQRQNNQNKLRQQAKIPIGFYFIDLFKKFELNYTYEQLINFTDQTKIQQNKIIQELIYKYCRQQYQIAKDPQGNKISIIIFEEVGLKDSLINTNICGQPLQFFGMMLSFLDMLDFYIKQEQIFELMMENYLNAGKFTQLSQFIMKLKNYHITQFNMNTINYQMISDFKKTIDLDSSFIDYTIEWIKKRYDSISNLEELNLRIGLNDRAINMLETFNKDSEKTRKQRALYQILNILMKFDPNIVLNIQAIKNQAHDHSTFIFMMHMFNKITIQKFTNINSIDDQQKVQHLFRIFQSHKQHVYSKKVDFFHKQFIRFLIEVCIKMIDCNYYSMAQYLILYKIPNDQQYFKDVLLLFLAAAQKGHKMTTFSNHVVQKILTPQTTSLIRINLETITNDYNFKGFIPIKVDPNNLQVADKSQMKGQRPSEIKNMESRYSEERPEQKLEFYSTASDIFKLALSKHWTYDAFFFLVRAKIVRNDSLKNAAQSYFVSYTRGYDQEMLNIRFHACFLVTSYCKALDQFIEKQFYPTFAFFSGKVQLLQDQKERVHVIKDIFIAMSKLQRLYMKNQKNRKLFDIKNQLQSYYQGYMDLIGQDADIKLVDSQAPGNTATVRTELFSRANISVLPAEDQQSRQKEIVEKKKEIQMNINRTHQVQQDSRLNVLNRQVNQYITDIRTGNERHAALQAQIKKQAYETSLAQRKAKELQQIKKKQKEDIESIKDTYKSNTTKRVNDLIQNLRKRREQIKTKTYAPTSAVRQSINLKKSQNDTIVVNINPPQKESAYHAKYPITTGRPSIQQKMENMKSQNRTQNKLLQLQKKMFQQPPTQSNSGHFGKKITFDEITTLYRQKQSVQALQCIQKHDMLKNPPVRVQLIKRVYAVTVHLQLFLQFIKYLIESDPSWKESVQEKAIPIATQMLKMQPKEKITIKEIIPSQLFTKVAKLNAKDYYPIAFEMLKSSLKKIFQKDLMPVHAVGILFRYSLGSENRFYNKVFYEYYSVILKQYEIRNYDDREVTLLAERIRSNYSSLPDSKDHVLEELLSKITNHGKRTKLLEALIKIIDRKGDSLVGGQANKQISFVVQKLNKM